MKYNSPHLVFKEGTSRMTDKKAVIFDFGGVLIDWNPYYLLRKVMVNDTEIEGFLQEISFKAWNYECDKGLSISGSIDDMCRKFPHRTELLRTYNERWLETLGRVFEKNVELLKTLKDRGVPVYGLSNWSADKFAIVEQRYDFFNWFVDKAISGREKTAKPDPQLARILLERNHLKPSDCVYIDDSEDNIRMGRQLGLNCVLYRSSAQLREELIKWGFNL
jgi:2-haloacid dehalogenase